MPINAGPVINTPGDEITPFYDYNAGMLYFSSDWHQGFGGFDIFRTKHLNGTWNKPQNIGYPYNTSFNDLYFTINENDSSGYLTSNRPGSYYIKSQTCCNDIYSWKIEKPKSVQKNPSIDSINKVPVLSSTLLAKGLLPLTLYFHNDVPFSSTHVDTCDVNYKTSVAEYYLLKEKYQQEYSKGMKGMNKSQAEKDIEEFFETLVMPGMTKLESFTSLLITDLKAGSDVKITVKGYTSPLNSSEYNKHLAQRRIISLSNFFAEYQDGILLKYLNKKDAQGGRLVIEEEPIGKEQASKLVSDNPHDLRNSVFSKAAALERRIQILNYESIESKDNFLSPKQITGFKDSPTTTLSFVEDFYDFGNVRAGSHVAHDFRLKNTGKMPLRLFAMETNCGCTVVDWPKDEIKPGATAIITVSFDSSNKIGQQTGSISLKANIPEGEKAITFKALVKP